jgi:uncharacterized membrane protein
MKKTNMIPILMLVAFSLVSAVIEGGCYGSEYSTGYFGIIFQILVVIVLTLLSILLYKKINEKEKYRSVKN